ncbi:hypothetical protein [Peloplasma aerotolerans]|uniref:Uncharacterized protein n=1 Tax=Peloplasma aerotolerans TaxID=3044389 RepID=A0AAW6U6U0_9MOLU|nr:hypothetical protein [Mariniplasma sp. M4Ah]MDI6453681.1 hypothetical protein [Mariniplasma sp. M4Ah]
MNATDEVSPFFKNIYSLKESEEAINVDDLDDIEELIKDEDFAGFIQNIKEAYQDEE